MHKQYVFCLHVLCVNCTVCAISQSLSYTVTWRTKEILFFSKERAERLENWPGQNFVCAWPKAVWKLCWGGECCAMINCSKNKLVLYAHAQMVFKTLACLVQEKNKYKFFACFLSILKIVPKYAVSGFFRFHWLIFFIVKFRLHQFSSLSISLWSPPPPPSIRQILYAQKCGKQYQLLLQLITSLVFLYHRGRKRPMQWF